MENNVKKMLVHDHKIGKMEDDINIRPMGVCIVKDAVTGEVLYKGKNKITVAGSAFTAMKHFNIPAPVTLPSYNSILELENSEYKKVPDGVRREDQVFLFAVGNDGCGKTPKELKPVVYSSWISPDHLIPFKYQPMSNDLNSADRQKYFGRKVIETDKRIAYYFKKFENEPEFIQQYQDGTPIDENVYTSARTDEIESFVKLHLIVGKDDCKEYFINTIGEDEASLSSISILTAYETKINGQVYYQNIRPLTKYHFPIESLLDATKALDITYILYY